MFNLKRVSPLMITGHRTASHYDILGITPSATQADIKAAYYNLSKKYHPDVCQDDEESSTKFRKISEAYEVLGNVKMKKLYDKGVLSRGFSPLERPRREEEPEDPSMRFYKFHSQRSEVPTMDGRKPIYDFEAWSRNHYGETFQRDKAARERIRHRQNLKRMSQDIAQEEAVMYSIVALFGVFIYCCAVGNDDFDRPTVDTTKKT